MTVLSTFIESCEISRRQPFVYAVYSLDLNVVYIGETFSYLGALGRLSQHLGRNGNATFRKRVCEVFRYEDVSLLETFFFAVPLSAGKLFTLPDYRRAVECLVHRKVMSCLAKINGPKVISRVYGNSYYCSDDNVQREVEKVVKEILNKIQTVRKCGNFGA